jgi:glycosyltransferase involved in cell wall biosynthesis
MTRILFIGDLANTGFGTVTRSLGLGLLALGEDVRFLSQNELGELQEPFRSRTLVVNDQMAGWHAAANRGQISVRSLLEGGLWPVPWAPEAVILTADYYAARGFVFLDDDAPDAFASVPTYHYCPVEGVGLPKAWRRLWDIVHPVAMSEFGADEIAKVTGTRPPMIYHGVDTATFYPVSAARPIRLGTEVLRSKEDCRRHFGYALNYRLCLRTDTNVPRKDYGALIDAMGQVMAERPDVALLWHCRTLDEGGDLRDWMMNWPRSVTGRMASTGHHDRMGYGALSPAELNALYNCADLYVSTSSEGFGLTIAEALACGVPAVGMNYSSVPEVIGPAGLVVPVRTVWRNPYGHWWGSVDEPKFAAAVGSLLDDERERKLLGAKGPHHVAATFSWANAARQFSELVGVREMVAA